MTVSSTTTTPARIEELDGLRGIAIGLVLIWHGIAAPAQLSPNALLHFISRLGLLTWSGVDLFFVLSGFLIGGILLRAKTSQDYYRVFYARRALRILPLYVVLSAAPLLLVALSARLGGRFDTLFGHPFPWYVSATFTQNFWMARKPAWDGIYLAATWSLAIEEQFYLTLPFVVRNVSTRMLVGVAIVVIIAAPFFRLFTASHVGPIAPYTLVICRADALMFGVLAAIATHRKQPGCIVGRQGRAFLTTATFLFGSTLLVFIKLGWGMGTLAMNGAGYSILAAFYTCLLLLALDPRNVIMRRVLRVRILTGLGGIAYGVYLIHQALLYGTYAILMHSEPHLDHPRDSAPLFIAGILTIGIAALSWRYFEKPLIALGHHCRFDPTRVSRPTQ